MWQGRGCQLWRDREHLFRIRQPDPQIASQIYAALGDAQTVLNVGAGAGSYEPIDREVTAVEPSASMRSQRPRHLPIAIDATAEKLPFPNSYFDASMATFFDASMATFTVHQWSNLAQGLGEVRRVTRGPAVILSCDPDALDRFWLHEYAPEVTVVEGVRYPAIATIAELLGGQVRVIPVAIPLDCRDGFNEAYYGRPEKLLDENAGLACSGWSFIESHVVSRFTAALHRDLKNGAWDKRFGHLRSLSEFEGPLRLIVAYP